ncbi:MAG: hypothetical protein ACI9O6_000199 [Glaciecola sp.]|jgi:uncharacterized protein YdiU (UPF0061 family)
MQLFHHYASELSEICSQVKPFPVTRARVAMRNETLAKDLGIDIAELETPALLSALFSNDGELQKNSIAQKYGGHQFGQWNPHLGDGRGLLLGEIKSPAGQFWDLHLKGAGPTPYSRHADGRAVLRSTIREYLAGEALHALGIPSSRSLCLLTSEEPVQREQLERGAMMIRTCESHLRFGHFEFFHHSNQPEQLEALFAYSFKHHFPECLDSDSPHQAMFQTIVDNTALMIAKWQAYGFNHGVMNTDNMSIHGITFDYGPYAFLDDFIPEYVCNRSDHNGRYAFDQQPSIGLWNLNALAHAFTPFMQIEDIKTVLMSYEVTLLNEYQTLMKRRLGLHEQVISEPKLAAEIDIVISEWMDILKDERADFHQSFRVVSEHLLSIENQEYNNISDFFVNAERVKSWCESYRDIQQKLFDISGNNWAKTQSNMLAVNPKFILRNHLAQEAIAAAEDDDFSLCEALITVLSSPFDDHPEFARFAKPPADPEKGIALSCSS